ncbi:MAG: U32 family peptidase [Candidatus Omnitrophica bacterium]|nr:U32 family peptidase [Candidatus Omnitrophota bacterium]
MKIKAPLTHQNEVQFLCDAGADEFFCGIEPGAWRTQYENFCINQRVGSANFSKLGDLEKAIRIAHQNKAKVHVTVNAFFYLEKQYSAAKNIIRDALGAGADGIIIADFGLLSLMDKNLLKGKDVVAGCDTAVFNHQSTAFYKKFDVTRIVFPRAMTIGEMEDVIKQDGSLEYEAFILHDLCFFVDAFCAYCKESSAGIKQEGKEKKGVSFFAAARVPARGFGGGCRSRFSRQRVYLRGKKKSTPGKAFTFWGSKAALGCGACAIYDLNRIGVTCLKVLDRNLPTEEKVKATAFIKKCLDFLNGHTSKQHFISRCQALFKKTFKVRCDRYGCYYPSVFRSGER